MWDDETFQLQVVQDQYEAALTKRELAEMRAALRRVEEALAWWEHEHREAMPMQRVEVVPGVTVMAS